MLSAQERGTATNVERQRHGGVLSLLVLFYGSASLICFCCTIFAPWFKWGFLTCTVTAMAGLLMVVKHYRSCGVCMGASDQIRLPLESLWRAFLPLAAIVMIAAGQVSAVLYDYFLG
jgi:hypothetical protein